MFGLISWTRLAEIFAEFPSTIRRRWIKKFGETGSVARSANAISLHDVAIPLTNVCGFVIFEGKPPAERISQESQTSFNVRRNARG